MAIFSVYADASGGDPAQEGIVVGGFIAAVEQWDSFSKDWQAVLANGPLDIYHAADVEDAERLWGWTKEHKSRVQEFAYKTIGFRVECGVSTALIKADFNKHKIVYPEVLGKSAFYYVFCVHDFIKDVTDWGLEHKAEHPISYFFELGDLGQGEVEKIFAELVNDPHFPEERRRLIGPVTFVPKAHRFPPLQAADIWAYENYKQLINQHLPLKPNKKRLPVRKGYELLFRRWWTPYNTFWNENMLAKFAKRQRAANLTRPLNKTEKRIELLSNVVDPRA
jgi:hypothetical protein